MELISIINLVCTWALIGLVWTIQLTHYPTFHHISELKWKRFHKHHTFSISLVVMPLMLIEIGATIIAVYYSATGINILALILVIGVWLNTFLQAVPLHNQLASAKNRQMIDQLVRVNWIRTLLWTAKGGILLYTMI